MKVRWYRLLTWMLGAMGFSSCALEMYGTPYSDYAVKITVVDEEGTPVKGIEAVRTDDFEKPYGEKMYSDGNGEISTAVRSMYIPLIALTDVDGEANGGDFESQIISHENYKFTATGEAKGWYKGSYSAKTTVTLKKKSGKD